MSSYETRFHVILDGQEEEITGYVHRPMRGYVLLEHHNAHLMDEHMKTGFAQLQSLGVKLQCPGHEVAPATGPLSLVEPSAQLQFTVTPCSTGTTSLQIELFAEENLLNFLEIPLTILENSVED